MATGKCLCGAVSYNANADAIFGGHCYCNDCRKTSSSHTSVVAYPLPAVSFSGELKEYACTGGSGMSVARGFCPNCGTQVYSKAEGLPSMILIKAGTLDEPETFKPAMSIFASRAPSWDQPPSNLPAFPEAPPQGG
jgi:hypothetical protein